MSRSPLAFARSPRAWRRGLERAVAPLRVLRRASAWLDELVGVRLRLLDEPLYGICFEELALEPLPSREGGAGAAPAAVARRRLDDLPLRPPRRPGVAARPRRDHRPPPPAPRSEASRRRERPSGWPPAAAGVAPPRPPGSAPGDPGQRAGRELLERLAASGEAALAAGRLGTRRPPSRRFDPRPSRHRDDGPRTLEEGVRRAHAAGGVFARREARLDRAALGSAAGTRAGRSREEGGGLPPRRIAPNPFPSPWRLGLDGERAPAELLRRWRSPAAEGPPSRGRSGRPAASPAGRGAPPGGSVGSGGAAHPGGEASRPGRREPPDRELPDREPRQEAAASGPPAAAPGGGTPAAATLLPPSPPPSLPPFPGARGVGGGDARRPALEARHVLPAPAGPAAPPADDLDALSVKIQRILDEQARRHGIPV